MMVSPKLLLTLYLLKVPVQTDISVEALQAVRLQYFEKLGES